MKHFHTNVDSYNYLVERCMAGYRQDIQRGSFANETTYRQQAFPLMLCIVDPANFLYLPKTVTPGMIEKYYQEYIINPERKENEVYTYGERIMRQLPAVLTMLSVTPKTNQASISISQPSDIELADPPCLRELTFSAFHGSLHLTSYWRSNDISEAFLINQGGLALLLKDAAEYAGLAIGSHFYCSPGAHVYVR